MSPTPPTVDVEEDKSYVFLLYPPGYENSINPDHILARYCLYIGTYFIKIL